MRLVSFFLFVAILGCSMGGGEGGGGAGQGGPEGEEGEPVVDPRILVEAEPAAQGAVGDHVVASAAVESEAQAMLVPETVGLVTGIYVEEGDSVSQGQLLAVIASPSLDAAYQRASSELERAEADAAAAERLFDQGALSRAELDTAARALTAARTAHQEASQTRGFTRLESPIAGVVAQRNVRFGETAGAAAAFTIVDPDRLRVVVALPERDLARVAVGQPARIVSAYDDAVAGTGKVVRVAPIVDTATGTVRVTVALDPGQRVLRPGQFVSVQIEVARHEGVVTVPRRAVVWEEGRSYAWRLLEGPPPEKDGEDEKPGEGKDGEDEGGEPAWWEAFLGGAEEEEKEPEIPGPWRRASKVAVKLGFEDGTLAEITEGLAAGEVVITVGNQALRDDARVRLPEDPKLEQPKKDEEAKEDAPPAAEG